MKTLLVIMANVRELTNPCILLPKPPLIPSKHITGLSELLKWSS